MLTKEQMTLEVLQRCLAVIETENINDGGHILSLRESVRFAIGGMSQEEEETVWVVGKKTSNGDNIPVKVRKSEVRYYRGGMYDTYDLCVDAISRLQEQRDRVKQRFRTKDGSPLTEFEVVFHGRINNDGLTIVPCNLKGPDGDFMVLSLSITFNRWIAYGSMSSYIVELKRIEQRDPIVI